MQHLVVILANMTHTELVMIVEYIYKGEISVAESYAHTFLSAARHLQIPGLEYLDTDRDSCPTQPQDLSIKTASKRRRVEETLLGQDQSVKENVISHHVSREMSNTMRLPTGIFAANMEKLNENLPTSRLKIKESSPSSKLPSWSQSQLQEAIESVITQKLRFTQASMRYGIPKGTLYDNILGKSKRMVVLDQVGLTETQELSVLEFCCEVSSMPYNRRTSRSLKDIIQYISALKEEEGEKEFQLSMRQGFRWWWAFTKKHNIISLYYQDNTQEKPRSNTNTQSVKSVSEFTLNDQSKSRSSSPEEILNLLENTAGLPFNLPTSSLGFPALNTQPRYSLNTQSRYSLNTQSKYSLNHPDYSIQART